MPFIPPLVKDRFHPGRYIARLKDCIRVFYAHELRSLAELFSAFSGSREPKGVYWQYELAGLSDMLCLEKLNLPPPEPWLSPSSLPYRLAGTLSVSALLSLGGVALALPQGYESVEGNIQFQQSGNTLNISTQAQKSIAQYQQFNVGQGETVNFNLPNAQSAILNRVVGPDASQILGKIQSNGQVFLANPNGIIFGQGAQVNVTGLLATTLSISNPDFLAGQYKFSQEQGKPPAWVKNQGQITTEPGGYVVLAGGSVENSGLITSPGGNIHLAVGKQLTVGVDNNLSVELTVDEALSESVQGVQVGIANSGTLSANQGGVVKAHAKLADNFYQRSINNTGHIEATGLGDLTGEVVLQADRGQVRQAGTIDVGNNTGHGGAVRILGETVALTEGSQTKANGQTGGGEILIGGDWQGQGNTQTAWRTYMGEGATIEVNATQTGHGGKVVVWANDRTWFYGDISARGGLTGGNGGQVEVSGKQFLTYQGQVDTRAPQGQTGTLLLDPTNIEVVNAGSETSALTDADAFADPDIGGDGDVKLDVTAINNALSNVTLQASNNILFSAPINITTAGVKLFAYANNDITVNQSITLSDGTINLYADYDANNVGQITLNAPITINRSVDDNSRLQGARIQINNTITATGSRLHFAPSTNKVITFGGSVDSNDTATELDISLPELNRITTNNYVVFDGTGYTAGIRTAGNINLSGSRVSNLRFESNGTVIIDHSMTTNNKYLFFGRIGQIDINSTVNTGTGQIHFFNYGLTKTYRIGGSVADADDASTLDLSQSELNFITTSGLYFGHADWGGTVVTGGHIDLSSTNISNFNLRSGTGITVSHNIAGPNSSIVLLSSAAAVPISLSGNLSSNSSISISTAGSGNIIQTAGTLTAPTVNLTSGTGNIGSSGNRIRTATTTLTANTVGTGGIWITEADSITLNASTSGTAGLNLFAHDDIIVNQAITIANGFIKLYADRNGNNTGNLVINAPISITQTGGTYNSTVLSGAGIQINQAITSNTTHQLAIYPSTDKLVYVGGSVDNNDSASFLDISQAELNRLSGNEYTAIYGYSSGIRTAGNISLASSGIVRLTLTANTGPVVIDHTIHTNNKELLIDPGQLDINAAINTGTNNLFVLGYNTSKTLRLGGAIEDNDTGSIVDLSQAELERITGHLIFGHPEWGAPVITGGNINLSTTQIDSLYLGSSSSISIAHNISTNGKHIYLYSQAGGTITLGGNITATGNTIHALTSGAGNINWAAGTLAGTTVNLTSGTGNIGNSGNRIQTAATTLTANTGGTGGVWITETDDITLGNSTAGSGGFDLQTNTSIQVNGNITTNNSTLRLGADSDTSNSGSLIILGSLNSGSGWVNIAGSQFKLSGSITANSSVTFYQSANKPFYIFGTVDDADSGAVLDISQPELGRITANTMQFVGKPTTAANYTVAASGPGAFNLNLYGDVTINHSINSNNHQVYLYGGQIKINNTINAGTNLIYISAHTPNTIQIGGNVDDADTASILDISSQELSRLTAGTLNIGWTGMASNLSTQGNISWNGELNLQSGSNFLIGHHISAAGHLILSGSTTVTAPVTLTADSDGNNTGILQINSPLSTGNNNLVLVGAQLDLNQTINAGLGSVTIIPTGSRNLYIGGSVDNADTGSVMDVSLPELMRITASHVSLGSTYQTPLVATAGNITLNASGSGSYDILLGSSGIVRIDHTIDMGAHYFSTYTSQIDINQSIIALRLVSIYPDSARTIQVGNAVDDADTSSILDISQAELNRITAPGVVISNWHFNGGITTAGNISLTTSGALTLADAGVLTIAHTITTNNQNLSSLYASTIHVNQAVLAGTGNISLSGGANGNINLAANLAGSTLALTADGSGNITQTAGTLNATTLNLTSDTGNIGSSGNRIRTATTTLTANTGGTGGVWITEADAVILNTSTSGSAGFDLKANTDLTVSGTLNTTSNGIIVLYSDNDNNNSGNLTINNTLNSGNGTMAIRGAQIDINQSISAGSGTVYLGWPVFKSVNIAGATDDADSATVIDLSKAEMARITAGKLSVQGNWGTITLLDDIDVSGIGAGKYNLQFGAIGDYVGNIVTTGRAITLGNKTLGLYAGHMGGAGGNLNVGNIAGSSSNITLYADTNLIVNGTITSGGGDISISGGLVNINQAVNAGTGIASISTKSGSNGDISLASGVTAGTINLTANGSGNISRTGGTLTATNINLTSGTGNIGASGSRIAFNATAGTLTANTGGSGSAYLSNSSGTSTTIGASTVGGTFLLHDGPNTYTTGAITAGSVDFSTGNGYIIGAPITTTGGTLAITSDHDLSGPDTLSIGGTLTSGGGNIVLRGGAIRVASEVNAGTGNVTLAGTYSDAWISIYNNISGAQISLTANGTGNIRQTAGTLTATTISLTAGTGTIGASANRLRTTASTLTANTGGTLYLTETDAITLGASTIGGLFDLSAGDSVTVNGVVTANDLAWATTANNGNIVLNASVTATAGAALTAHGSGNITQTAGTLNATTLNLTSTTGNIGTSANRIQANTATLAANTGGAGNIFITEADAVTLNASSSGTGELDIRANTNITVAGALTSSYYITIYADSDSNQSGNLVVNAPITSTNSIYLQGQQFDINQTLNAGTAQVQFQQRGTITAFQVGGATDDADAAGIADISEAELNRITAGSVRLYSSGQTPIRTMQNIVLNTGGQRVYGLSLANFGSVSIAHTITTNNMNLGLSGQTIDINQNINAGTASVTISGPGWVNGTPIYIGGAMDDNDNPSAPSGGSMDISQQELNRISAGTLHFSNTYDLIQTSGNISWNGALILSTNHTPGLAVNIGHNLSASGNLLVHNTSPSGQINITGSVTLAADSDGNNSGLLQISGPVSFGSNNLTLRGAQIDINQAVSGTGYITLAASHNKTLQIGNATDDADSASAVDISQAELNRLTASGLSISSGQGIVTAGNTLLPVATNFYAPSLTINHSLGQQNIFTRVDVHTNQIDINQPVTFYEFYIHSYSGTPTLTVGGAVDDADTASVLNLSQAELNRLNGTFFGIWDFSNSITLTTAGDIVMPSSIYMFRFGQYGHQATVVNHSITGQPRLSFGGSTIAINNNVTSTLYQIDFNTYDSNDGTTTINGNITAATTIWGTLHGTASFIHSSGTLTAPTISLSTQTGNIGTSANRIQTNAATLTVNTGGSGNIYINEANALTLGASSAGGTLDITAGGTISTSGALTAPNVSLATAATGAGITLGTNHSGGNLLLQTSGTGSPIVVNGNLNGGNITVQTDENGTGSPITINGNVLSSGNLKISGYMNAAHNTGLITINGDVTNTGGANTTVQLTAVGNGFNIAGNLNITQDPSKDLTLSTLNDNGNLFRKSYLNQDLTFRNIALQSQGGSSDISIGGSLTAYGNLSITGTGGLGELTILGDLNHYGGAGTYVSIAMNSIIDVQGQLNITQSSTKDLGIGFTNNWSGLSTNLFTKPFFAQDLQFNNINLRSGHNQPINIGGNWTISGISGFSGGNNSPITQTVGKILTTTTARFDMASDIGSAAQPIQVAAGTLTPRTTGSVYINEADNVRLNWFGWLDPSAGGTFQLKAGGNITTSNTASTLTADTILLETTANNGFISLSANVTAANGITLITHGTGNITVDASRTLTTTNAPVNITANDIKLNGSINTGSGIVTLMPNGNKTIAVGDSADGNGNDATFDINVGELSRITAGSVIIGNLAQSGGVTLLGNLDLSGTGAGKYNLTLNNAGNLTATDRSIVTGSNRLNLNTTGNINFTTAADNMPMTFGTVNGNQVTLSTGGFNSPLTLHGNLAATGDLILRTERSNLIANGGITHTGSSGSVSLQGSRSHGGAGFYANGAINITSSNTKNVFFFDTNGTLFSNAFFNQNLQYNWIDFSSYGTQTMPANFSASAASNLSFRGTYLLTGAAALIADSDGNNGGTLTIGLVSGSGLTTNNHALTLQGAQVRIDMPVNTGSGTLTLLPSLNKAVQIGGAVDNADSASVWDISHAELSRITAGNVQIGSTARSGGLSTAGSITLPGSYHLNLANAGSITLNHTVTTSNRNITVQGSQINLNQALNAGTGNVTLQTLSGSNGSIQLAGNIAGNSVLLSSHGSGIISRAAGTLNATSLQLVSGSGDIGAANARIWTNAQTLSAQTTGNVYLNETDAVSLSTSTAGGTFNLLTGGSLTLTGSLNAGNIVLATQNNGGIQLNGNNITASNGLSLQANGSGNIQGSGLLQADSLSLASGSGNLGQAGNKLNTRAGSLSLAGGSAYIAEADALSLGTTNLTGSLDLDSGNTLRVTGAVTAQGPIQLATLTGDIHLDATITSAGSGILLSSAGAILDGNGSGLNLSAAGNTTLRAGQYIGTLADALEVQVTNGTLSIWADGLSEDVSANLSGVVSPVDALGISNLPPGLVIYNGRTLYQGQMDDFALLAYWMRHRHSVNTTTFNRILDTHAGTPGFNYRFVEPQNNLSQPLVVTRLLESQITRPETMTDHPSMVLWLHIQDAAEELEIGPRRQAPIIYLYPVAHPAPPLLREKLGDGWMFSYPEKEPEAASPYYQSTRTF